MWAVDVSLGTVAEQIVGRERRERVSQLAWCGAAALIRAAASTQPFDTFQMPLYES